MLRVDVRDTVSSSFLIALFGALVVSVNLDGRRTEGDILFDQRENSLCLGLA